MNQRDLLLAAVCDNPDEDTPRLVFADWLQENGDEDRAEFIRLQIRSAAVPEEEHTLAELGREEDLLSAHRDEWVDSVKAFESYRGDFYKFRRGFVECIAANGEALAEDGERLFALAPVRELYLNDTEEYGALAKCKWLLRLRALDLKGSGLSHHFDPAPLIGSPYLANLTALGLGGEDDNGHLDIHGIRALVASPHLGRLESLDLSGNWLNAEAFAHFLTAANLPALRTLNLRSVGIGDEGAVALAAVPWVSRMKVLDLAKNGIGDSGARALAAAPLASIENLDLRDKFILLPHNDSDSVSEETKQLLRERFGSRVRL